MTFVCVWTTSVHATTYLIRFMNHRLLLLLIIIIYQSMLGFFDYSLVLCSLWSFFFPYFISIFSRIMSMIEMSWHTIYVNVLRQDYEPSDMHKSRSCASYLAHGSVVAYSCVQRPMYIYESVFLIYFGIFREKCHGTIYM